MRLPTVSVVIPTRGRPGAVLETVRAVLDDPAATEIVVVIDGEDRETEKVLAPLGRGKRLIVDSLPSGVASAHPEHPGRDVGRARRLRDHAVGIATSEIILAIDDDVVACPGLVTGHARRHAAKPALVVLGYMPVAGGGDAVQLMYRDSYERACARFGRDPETVLRGLWAGNFSVGRVHWIEAARRPSVGAGYHVDREFGIHLRALGLHGVFDRTLLAEHRFERSLRDYLLDLESSAAGLCRLYAAYPGLVEDPRSAAERLRLHWLTPVLVALFRHNGAWSLTMHAAGLWERIALKLCFRGCGRTLVRGLSRLALERALRQAFSDPHRVC